MEILNILLERLFTAPENITQLNPLAAVGLISMAAESIAGIASGIIGHKKRREEREEADEEYSRNLAEFKNFQFQNLYADIENPMEDLRVGTQAADFQAQQTQQSLAQTLEALRSSGGGAGAAAVAQSLAQAQSRSQQQIAAGIEQQELSNERARAQAQAQLNLQSAAGGMAVQDMEMGRTQTLLSASAQRKQAADAAKQQATKSIISGVAGAGGLTGTMAGLGAFSGEDGAFSDALSSMFG